MKQASFFDSEQNNLPATEIAIRVSQTNLLSKQQQSFNKLVAKIEKLKSVLDKTTKTLNEKLDFYGKNIHPLEQQLTALNIEITKLLFKFFIKRKSLSNKERQSLKNLLSNQLTAIFRFLNSEPDDELKSIFKTINGLSFDEAKEEDFKDMMSDLQDMFENNGFEMDMKDMHSKMTEEEIIKKMLEFKEKINQENSEKSEQKPERKKTKKQLLKEEKVKMMEEAKTKNIGSIYKQLAKLFHPDLERNEDKRIEKEELMKKLTVAYENNDLHTILRLELAWIQKEENNLSKLTDDKLSIYNEVLKQQAQDLQNQINMEKNHPRYQPLQRFADYEEIQNINLVKEKKQIEGVMHSLRVDITQLKSNDNQSVKTVKRVIHEFQEQDIFDNEFFQFFQ